MEKLIELIRDNGDYIETVSYTHLDVYKRQLLYSLVQITDDVGKRTGFGNSHSRSLFVKGGPVSYTHLDVYKRQTLNWATLKME